MAKSDGGGSILDQSHIMDLIHYLLGPFKNVSAFNSKISPLEIRSDDIAELIAHENGVIASIHTDIFGRKHEKNRVERNQREYFWDFYKRNRIYNSKIKKIKMIKNFLKTLIQTILTK